MQFKYGIQYNTTVFHGQGTEISAGVQTDTDTDTETPFTSI
jgi:hypothetical protein